MSPTDPHPEMEAFARELERETRRVDKFEASTTERLDAFDVRVCNLAEVLDRLINDLDAHPQSWLLVSDPDVARAMLADLVKWLDLVYFQYSDAYLSACWAFHPAVIEELWWLSRAWAAAFSGRGWADKVGLWHDQRRQRAVDRIRKATSTCAIGKHLQPEPPLAAPLAGHIDAIADAWVKTGVPPVPTAAQVREALAYEERTLERTDS